MTLVVIGDDGVTHEVYNKTEVRVARAAASGWVTLWRVRTLCDLVGELDLFHAGLSNVRVHETGEENEYTVTCVRCAAVECDHGIWFDKDTAERFSLTSNEIKTRWPRLEGTCPKGCGYHGIAYASYEHYIYGDW